MATNFTNNSISKIEIQNQVYNIKSIPFFGTVEEWASNETYVPKQGELIIYDYSNGLKKIKIGDGTTTVGDLAFFENIVVFSAVPNTEDIMFWGTLSEVEAAITSKNFVLLEVEGVYYSYDRIKDGSYVFSAITNGTLIELTLVELLGTLYATKEEKLLVTEEEFITVAEIDEICV